MEMEILLEEAKEVVMAAMRVDKKENGRATETYSHLVATLTELEDVWELDELSESSRSHLRVLGFSK